MLQSVAEYCKRRLITNKSDVLGCSVLQDVAVRCSVLQCFAVYCSVLQCDEECCSVLHKTPDR